MFNKTKNLEKTIDLLIKTQSAILKRDGLLIDKLQDRIEYLECVLNKNERYLVYPKIKKETRYALGTHDFEVSKRFTLGTHEFEVSKYVSIEDINTILLNFKNHYDVYISESGNLKTIMVKLIFDNTLYSYKEFNSLINIKEYLKHYKRY